ncbi:MAG TPA: NAD-dependent epimerase/dehydratase family protein [Thermoanaerobaculia bacterium]|nr:NAD-dependent epimerase/dehydratase family protein [Thermoanaerobaculia bacterium]
MRIFLTGATGYLGQALCRRLAGEHELCALVRPTSEVAPLRALGVALFEGDVRERASLRQGMSGADWVVHAAAELDPAAPAERMREVNVEGSRNVASLAYKLGVGRLLSISSVAYFGGSPEDGSPATEESPVRRPFPSPYSATKHAGQEAIAAEAARGLRVDTVYPSLVYGPPGKRGGANALLRAVIRGRFPALIGGDRRTSWVYLDDVVEGMVRVMQRSPGGGDYLLAGDTTTVRDLVHRICALAGVAPPRREISPRAARWLLRLAAPLWRLRGRRAPIAAGQLENLARHWAFDDTRARRELAWEPRALDAGLPPTVAFLQGRDARPEVA